jgi:membrane-bound ClpP family serine protease
MEWWVIVLILIGGWLLVFLEIFIIPGTTFFAIIGTGTMVTGIVLAYTSFGAVGGTITLVSTAVFTIASVVYGFRSGLMKGMMLKTKVEGKTNVIDESKIKVGDAGKAMSKIAPIGKGLINDETYEVQTQGEWIEEGTPIEVIRIALNKIYIKEKISSNG